MHGHLHQQSCDEFTAQEQQGVEAEKEEEGQVQEE
jgi:hypothetical protein